jgi:hypothetical protein
LLRTFSRSSFLQPTVPLPTRTITNAVADPLTDKVCRGKWYLQRQTQLQSKFFDVNPGVSASTVSPSFRKASVMPSSAHGYSGYPSSSRCSDPWPYAGVKAFMALAAEANKNNNDVSVVADSSVHRMLQDGAAQSGIWS